MAWNKNNTSAVATWVTLGALGQISKARTFPKTKKLKMKKLQFWSKTGSGGTRTIRAKILAIQLDAVYIEIWRAKYETGKTKKKSIDALQALLLKDGGKKTCADLAKIADAHYRFLDE